MTIREQRREHVGGGVGGLAHRALVDDLEARVGEVGDVLALDEDRGDLGLRGVERLRGRRLDRDRAERAVAGQRVVHRGQRREHDVVLVLDAV
jgi:hypothetical protein